MLPPALQRLPTPAGVQRFRFVGNEMQNRVMALPRRLGGIHVDGSHEPARRVRADRGEVAQVHEGGAVAVQAHDTPARGRMRDAERDGARRAHAAHHVELAVPVAELPPASSPGIPASSADDPRQHPLVKDVIEVFHPQVITMGKSYTMPFYSGIKEGGVVIINSGQLLLSEEDIQRLKDLNVAVFYIAGTELAIEIAGTELSTNMTMIGSVAGMTNMRGPLWPI